MNSDIQHKWGQRLLFALALALVVALGAVAVSRGLSAPDDPPCGVDGSTCPLVGDFEPVSGESASEFWQLSGPAAPAFGALVYDPDYKLIEQKARDKLNCGLGVREAISPYRGNVPFEQYVKAFDYEAGWGKGADPLQFADASCFGEDTDTLIEVINDADQNLREARDLYAYLAVYAPVQRFRADGDYTGDPPPGFDEALCGVTDKENPDPIPDPPNGLVLDPVIDWCNFPARLRQSVREAANLRLLFGQQFMVDAMGLHFSGGVLIGGENAVRDELAKLRAAKYQYELAEQGLAEAMRRNLGSGCFVSDFYTQPEWALLSRAVENQETAQHHIATRMSYMGIEVPQDVAQVHTAAGQEYRQASIDGYLKMIFFASLATGQPGVGCAVGERPDVALTNEMAENLLDTRRKAHELAEGRNVFGFDVSFTPARPYKSSEQMTCEEAGAGDRGLWDEAWCAALDAEELEEDEVANTRAFDDAQEALQNEAQDIRTNIDAKITAQSGASRSSFSNDQAWYDGVKNQVALLYGCQMLASEGLTGQVQYQLNTLTGQVVPYGAFEQCMENPAILNSDAKQALYDLRSIYVKFELIETKAANITERINLSNERNAKVRGWLITSGTFETIARVANSAQLLVSCLKPIPVDPAAAASAGTLNIACGVAGTANILTQATAGALSTAAKVEIEDADHHKEVGNLLLDESELVIEAYGARQQWLSKLAEYMGMLDSLARIAVDQDGQLLLPLKEGSLLLEAQRARAYFQHSPANDPSFRLVRDSSRLMLANQMEYATRMAYLAARRAEYEYAARLSASNFRISDIYRARTADDVKTYLAGLLAVTNSLAGGATYQTNASDFKISVAQHVLLLTDEALAKEGFTDPAAAQVERTRRFRQWVTENTINDPDISSKPVLRFSLTTSLLDGGLFSQVIQEGYDRYWLLKLSGIAEPKASSNGVSLNLVSDQAGLSYRTVSLTQGGLVHLRSFAGCTFDYRLMAPAALLGLEWASNQDPEAATAVWNANANEEHAYTENGFRTPTFLGRAASTTDWEVLLYSGAPVAGMVDMDLQQLTDIELIFSTTYASRTPGDPQLSECTRIDW
jgi:hypothetical protein